MIVLTPWQIDLIPWYGFALYWAVTALRVKPTKAAEKSADRLQTIGVLAVALVLLFDNRAPVGPLRRRFAPFDPRLAGIGILLTWLGLLSASGRGIGWARTGARG